MLKNRRCIKIMLTVVFMACVQVNSANDKPLSSVKLRALIEEKPSGAFYISFDSMEREINRRIKATEKFEAKNNLHELVAKIKLKIGFKGRIKYVRCLDYPKNFKNKGLHQKIITDFFYSMKHVKRRELTKEGKYIKIKGGLLSFYIDDCGYIKLYDSNSFQDQEINLLECPFAL